MRFFGTKDDFSKGERGKFYNKKARLNLPIYLEPITLSFVESITEKKNSDISKVVNELIKTDMKIAEYAEKILRFRKKPIFYGLRRCLG